MDGQFWWMIFKIIVFLPFIILLIYISMKYGGDKLQQIQNGRHIKILERTPISKENTLLVVKIGENAYVMASSNSKIEILSELHKDDIDKIEASKNIQQYENLKDFYEKTGLKNACEKLWKNCYSKLNQKKEDKNNE
ncbi:flagellar biosynthetic protein FliO [Clostridium sp. DJ247]|uniref:flagellar biosynthetic protein FliO n=1 Tax=Clostridium sp. DJ247 TaxID=2726188 RepID=UPI00162567D5|nr:flagellar biosynthetic protein FliO [Clostridium sp. DJ247]MBC2582137.1 flagellar biosynthetic protein FliO [Clostridium sp. DJ247]